MIFNHYYAKTLIDLHLPSIVWEGYLHCIEDKWLNANAEDSTGENNPYRHNE